MKRKIQNTKKTKKFKINEFLQKDVKKRGSKQVLSKKVTPEHYCLRVNVENDFFDGNVEIFVKINEETNVIILNSKDLILTKMFFKYGNKTLKGNCILKAEVAKINFKEVIPKDTEGILRINFKGNYNKTMKGFYIGDNNGTPLYSTHFEPTGARLAFPCFDQPDMKATFDISISADPSLTVLSNSSLDRQEGNVRYFKRTVKMSTYLVAYAVGSLDYIETFTNRGVPIRVYAEKTDVCFGEYALKIAKECLEFFEKYFGIEYAMPKLDLLAIPSFCAGAMENWGLITFRRYCLFYQENINSFKTKKTVASTICHEIAHMWFGNLVTMKWWNDIWLNESFATWASFLALNNISRELVDWDVWLGFSMSETEPGLTYDSLSITHQISKEILNPNDTDQTSGFIYYCKGASLIRMIENYIGQENFKKGVYEYLKTFKFENADSSDLWNSLSKVHDVNKKISDINLKYFSSQSSENSVSDVPSSTITEIMENWTKTKGFPLVTVEEDGNTIKFKQSLFSINNEEDKKKLWKIPLRIKFFGEGVRVVELKEKALEIEKLTDSYKVNIGSTGFYRVMYPEKNFKALKNEILSDADKLNLINDSYALAMASKTSIKDFIQNTIEYKDETTYEILESLFSAIYNISSIFYDKPEILNYLNGIVLGMVEEKAMNLDFERKNGSYKEAMMNNLLVRASVANKSISVIAKLKLMWEKVAEVAPEYKQFVYEVMADEKFDELLNQYKTETAPELKLILISALSKANSKENIEYILSNFTMFDIQDFGQLFSGLAMNFNNRNFIINWLCHNIDNLYDYINNSHLFNSSIKPVFSSISTKEFGDRVRKILLTKTYEESKRTIAEIIELADIRVKFRLENIDDFNF